MLLTIALAIALRVGVSFSRVSISPMFEVNGCAGFSALAGAAPEVGVAVSATESAVLAGAVCPPPETNASMSSFTMRPPLPVAVTCEISTSFSRAY